MFHFPSAKLQQAIPQHAEALPQQATCETATLQHASSIPRKRAINRIYDSYFPPKV